MEMDNYNYPAGADNASAPWNRKETGSKEFEVCAEATITRIVKLRTDDYTSDTDDETGKEFAVTDDTDWQRAYRNDGCMTPEEIIAAFSSFFPALMHYYLIRSQAENESVREEAYAKLKELERIKGNLYGWELEEISFREV